MQRPAPSAVQFHLDLVARWQPLLTATAAPDDPAYQAAVQAEFDHWFSQIEEIIRRMPLGRPPSPRHSGRKPITRPLSGPPQAIKPFILAMEAPPPNEPFGLDRLTRADQLRYALAAEACLLIQNLFGPFGSVHWSAYAESAAYLFQRLRLRDLEQTVYQSGVAMAYACRNPAEAEFFQRDLSRLLQSATAEKSPWFGRSLISFAQYALLHDNFGHANTYMEMAQDWYQQNTGPFGENDRNCQFGMIAGLRADATLRRGRIAEAEEFLAEAYRWLPERSWRAPELLELEVRIALEQGDRSRALTCIEALERGPALFRLHAYVHRCRLQPEEALTTALAPRLAEALELAAKYGVGPDLGQPILATFTSTSIPD